MSSDTSSDFCLLFKFSSISGFSPIHFSIMALDTAGWSFATICPACKTSTWKERDECYSKGRHFDQYMCFQLPTPSVETSTTRKRLRRNRTPTVYLTRHRMQKASASTRVNGLYGRIMWAPLKEGNYCLSASTQQSCHSFAMASDVPSSRGCTQY